MTSEEWIANISSEKDRKYAREAVNAALEKEREGEVVLGEGVLDDSEPTPWSGKHYFCNTHPKAIGKRGKLIFREDK